MRVLAADKQDPAGGCPAVLPTPADVHAGRVTSIGLLGIRCEEAGGPQPAEERVRGAPRSLWKTSTSGIDMESDVQARKSKIAGAIIAPLLAGGFKIKVDSMAGRRRLPLTRSLVVTTGSRSVAFT